MYTAHFALGETPFNLAPDPRFLYLSPQHQEALNLLIYGIQEKKGFVLLTGGIGTGKTTLCRTLLAHLDNSVRAALILNPSPMADELLSSILEEFEMPVPGQGLSRREKLSLLNDFLLQNYIAGKNAVLLIDEAQLLPLAVLEELRLLSNLETEREKLLQIILIGQPELQKILALPALRQLNERITVRYELKPLSFGQTGKYINHRLAVVGGQVRFSLPALSLLHHYSRGIPRRINVICDRALLIAYARGLRVIRRGIIRAAVRDVGRGYFIAGGFSARPIVAASLSLILLLLVAVYIYLRQM